MSDTPTRKPKTTKIGYRLRTDLINKFRDRCAAERRDPATELEHIIEQYLDRGSLPRSTMGGGGRR